MNHLTDHKIETLLRAREPARPDAALRTRILENARGEWSTTTTPAPVLALWPALRPALLALAASLIIAVTGHTLATRFAPEPVFAVAPAEPATRELDTMLATRIEAARRAPVPLTQAIAHRNAILRALESAPVPPPRIDAALDQWQNA